MADGSSRTLDAITEMAREELGALKQRRDRLLQQAKELDQEITRFEKLIQIGGDLPAERPPMLEVKGKTLEKIIDLLRSGGP